MAQQTEQFDRARHWNSVYESKADRDTSWHQDHPNPSLDLIREFAPKGGKVIDIGGGNSILAKELAASGFDLTVLDISQAGICRGQQRAGEFAKRIRWIVGDITQIDPPGLFDLWHDRAVFHFLTTDADRQRYLSLDTDCVKPGGHAVISTFSPQGPEQCSGLPVRRHDASMLAAAFSPAFELVRSLDHQHSTPWGKTQIFCFAVFRRVHAEREKNSKTIPAD